MTVIDLFCGAAGGWSLGFHRAGFQTVAACEVDPWRRAVFLQNNPGVMMYDDVRSVSAERLVSDLGYLPKVVIGSPPCQDASLARREKRIGIDGDRTGLFWEYMRIVREVRPRWICAENVIGLIGVGADTIASALVEEGYRVWLFNMGAEDFGSMCERRRIWFIAMANTNEEGLENTWSEPGTKRPDRIRSTFGSHEIARNQWGQGENDALRMADGFPPNVAATRCIAAYGDAIVPQIAEAIGRAILNVEVMLSEVSA